MDQFRMIQRRVFRVIGLWRFPATFEIDQYQLIVFGQGFDKVPPRVKACAKAVDAKQRPTLAVTFVVKLDWIWNADHLLLKTIRGTSFDRLHASGYVVNGVKNLCGVVSIAARITDSDLHIFQDDETLLVLK